jgi:hypothetical protein
MSNEFLEHETKGTHSYRKENHQYEHCGTGSILRGSKYDETSFNLDLSVTRMYRSRYQQRKNCRQKIQEI